MSPNDAGKESLGGQHMKIGVKASNKSRSLVKENWKDDIDLIEAEADEFDEWLEAPAAQEGSGRGRVRFVRADTGNSVLNRGRR